MNDRKKLSDRPMIKGMAEMGHGCQYCLLKPKPGDDPAKRAAGGTPGFRPYISGPDDNIDKYK